MLVILLFIAAAIAVALQAPITLSGSNSQPILQLARSAPPAGDSLAERMAVSARAISLGDTATLRTLLTEDDAAAYEAAVAIAAQPDVDPLVRYEALKRVAALRIDEPLARDELRDLALATGEAALASGLPLAAREAYLTALPDPQARDALRTLISDPFELANAFLDARLYQDALEVLDQASVTAASIEAPALRALARYEEARTAYRTWLEEIPMSRTAQLGLAWTHWYLGDLDAAEEGFTALGGSEANYGLGLIANRRGDIDTAVRFLTNAGSATRIWLATSILENAGRIEDAIRVYLDLALGDSAYADDAAWRARVLAERIGNADLFARADTALQDDSFFSLLLGKELNLPTRNDLSRVELPALQTAAWLRSIGDDAGARLVLAFALREASDEASIVTIGEALVDLGEYRIPQRAGAMLLANGSEQLRTWRLAYPRAWPEQVLGEATAAGVDTSLVWAIMRRESAFFPDAISRSGAQGLMQVMPATWDWLAELQTESPADPFTIDANIRYGVHYLGWLTRYFEGDEELVVASYNRGQGYIGRLWESEDIAFDRNELYRFIDALETREYLQNVIVTKRIYERLDGLETQLARP